MEGGASQGARALPVTDVATATAAHEGGDERATRFRDFLLVALQFALLLWLIRRFQLENHAFRLVVQAAFGGFLVHALLPRRLRLAFFSLLSLGTIFYFLGLQQGVWSFARSFSRGGTLLAVGLVLIGICRLPIKYRYRVALLLLAGAGLATLRSGMFELGSLEAIWPILGAMFMFRLIVYAYDTAADRSLGGPFQTLSYFFLFPNVWLFVSPVIDYRTFCRNYFDRDEIEIYQKGLHWMLRGIIHLLAWRIVYYHLYLDPSRIGNGTELFQYLFTGVGLYLRISGQFHFMVGMLHLFGFNLPETNRLYFLASSFTDYWRRINIYWRDFVMKVFFYPTAFRLGKRGPIFGIVMGVVVAFAATWFLHAYQWFWLRGSFPMQLKDIAFWGTLAVLVGVNSLLEVKRGKRPPIEAAEERGKALAGLGLRTAATFATVCLLWSIWMSDSIEQWMGIWQFADGRTVLLSVAVLGAIALSAIVVAGGREITKSMGWPDLGAPFRKVGPVHLVVTGLAILLLSTGALRGRMSPGLAELTASLGRDVPNKTDEEILVRGYYEELTDVSRFNNALYSAFLERPTDWKRLEETEVLRETNDLRTRELVPSTSAVLNGEVISANSAGLRDREYSRVKPEGTYRIALLGSSVVMGLGVSDGETFEQLLEDRINTENRGGEGRRYEILNFAVNGYTPFAQLDVLERVFPFEPDAIYLVGHTENVRFIVEYFAKSLRLGAELRHDYLTELAVRAEIDASTPALWAERRLTPFWPEMIDWANGEIVRLCESHGIQPVYIHLPGPLARKLSHRDQRLMKSAEDAGFSVISLFGAYGDVEPSSLMVAPWDAHPNAEGHRLIAGALLRELEANDDVDLFRLAVASDQVETPADDVSSGSVGRM